MFPFRSCSVSGRWPPAGAGSLHRMLTPDRVRLCITNGIERMTKITFGRQPRNAVGTLQHADVGETQPACAFEPVVVHGSGIEAIIEGLRLADVEGVEAIAAGLQCAKDVNRS